MPTPLMTRFPGHTFSVRISRLVTTIGATYAALCTRVIHAGAQVFQGSGLKGGVNHATQLQGISHSSDLREATIHTLIAVLNFLGLIAVTTVIIAGFFLVTSLGNDEAKEKAKKTILFTLAGLVIILFARVIVGFITVYIFAPFIGAIVGAGFYEAILRPLLQVPPRDMDLGRRVLGDDDV